MSSRFNETTISVLGGTAPQGRGLAGRFAAAGLSVVIGSRSADRAAETAAELGGSTSGATNAEAAAAGDLVIVAVPWGTATATSSCRSGTSSPARSSWTA